MKRRDASGAVVKLANESQEIYHYYHRLCYLLPNPQRLSLTFSFSSPFLPQITFLDSSSEAPKTEYEERQKELEAVANPIMTRLYGAGGAPGAEGGAPPASHDDGPSVEEVD